jgi:hypothetical protein
MNKRWLLLFLPLIAVITTSAQFFTGLRGSAFGGVTNVDYNPAIADSRFLVDINLIGVGVNAENNYIGINRQVLLHPSMFNDRNFQFDDLHERLNGTNKTAYAGAMVQGPLSFMASFGKRKNRNKNAIAFTYHVNAITNLDNVNQTLARSAFYGLGSQAQAVLGFLNRNLDVRNLTFNTAVWNDYGITYSRVLISKGENMLKIGGTLKLIQPLIGAGAYIQDLNYKWPQQGSLSVTAGNVNYGYTQGIIGPNGMPANISNYLANSLAYKYATPTAAVDMGAIYEWRPDKGKNQTMDCHCHYTDDRNTYKLAAGFSVMDFGAMRFNRGQYSESFNVQAQNWEVGELKLPNGVQSFDDSIRSKFQLLPNKKYMTLWLPTRFNMFLDYNIIKDFGIIFSGMVSPDMSPNHNMLHQVTLFTINPRYDYKWFGIYLPLSYDVMGNISWGATLRAGPFIIGTQDLLGLFAKKYVYNMDIHAAVKITIPQLAKCRKHYDVRFGKNS